MTEFKAPLNLRIKNFILGHIHLFLVITFIVLAVLFSSCGKAKAESMDSYCQDYILDYIQDNTSQYQFETVLQNGSALNDVFNSCPYFYIYGNSNCFIINFSSDSRVFQSIGYSYNDNASSINYVTSNLYSSFGNFSPCSLTSFTYSEAQNIVCYTLLVLRTSSSEALNLWTITCNDGINRKWESYGYNYCPSPNYSRVINSGGNFTYSSYPLSFVASYGESNRIYSRYDLTSSYALEQNITPPPPYVEDDRLKIYTINDNTGKDVVFDLDDFDFSNYDGSAAETQNTLVDNQIFVTVDYDGSDQVFTLDSTNSDILPAYLIETPLRYFNIDEFDNVKITKVEFSKLIHYRPSEMKPDETKNYKIACEYYLKKYVEPIEKGDNQFEDDLNGDKLTQAEIDDIYYTIHFSDGAGISFDDYELAPPEGYSVYTVYLKNTVSNWEDFIEDWEITVKEFYYLVLGSYNTRSAVEEYITEWVVDNKAALYWDVIEFEWIQENSSSLTRTYWYYTTESGRIRSISNVLADMYIQGNDIKVNTAAIFTSIDNFETESLEFFNAQLGFNSDAIEWLRSINNSVNSGFTSVVNAINSLDFTVPGYDDTDILDKLDDIITAIGNIGTSENEIDTPQECIDFYLENIDRDINDIEFDLRPAYYEGMTLYILYSFDIDDNYSDDVQRASMRGTKASNPISDSENILVKVIITLRDTFTSSDAHNVINSTLKDMNGRSDYYTLLFGTYYDCQEWEGWVND